MFERHTYKSDSESDWRTFKNPVGTLKYDGANFFMQVGPSGDLRFFSRRESVKGGFPERTQQLPHLTTTKLPQYANNVYNVELIHTGLKPNVPESHRTVSGILNSLPGRSIETQTRLGPIRVKIHNVVEPKLLTYKEKLEHMKEVEKAYGNPDLVSSVTPHYGHSNVDALIESSKREGREGVIVADLDKDESKNPRVKVKHLITYNLQVTGIVEELDKNGKPKGTMGSLEVSDRSGRVVGNVGTGFNREFRKWAWMYKKEILNTLIQVKTMGLAANKLRMPVYNGDADGELECVNVREP